MNKRTISFVAMIVSALLFLCGLLVIFGAFGGNTNYASSAPYSYDSGYATFGTDFYTYVSNNAEEAASASRVAANNLDKIGSLLKSFCGIMLMGFGLLNLCRYTMVWLETKADSAAPVQAPKASEPAPNPSECEVPYAGINPPGFVDDEPTVLFCRNCGNTLKPGQVFCGNCGTPVR